MIYNRILVRSLCVCGWGGWGGGGTFVIPCLLSCARSPTEKRSKREELAPIGSNSFLLQKTPFQKGEETILIELPPNVYFSIKHILSIIYSMHNLFVYMKHNYKWPLPCENMSVHMRTAMAQISLRIRAG